MLNKFKVILVLNTIVFFGIINAQDTTSVADSLSAENQTVSSQETKDTSNNNQKEIDSENPQDQKIDIKTLKQSILDSLQFSFDEKLDQKRDSLTQDFAQKQQKFLNKHNIEREQYSQKIQILADSIRVMNNTLFTVEPVEMDYDKFFEAKYFSYVTGLKEENKKQGFFGKIRLGSENLLEYKIQEMTQYIDFYFPGARCAEAQDLIIQLYLDGKKYSEAEIEFIKFVFFYVESPKYENIVDKYKKRLKKLSYYKDRMPFINKNINIVSKNPDIAIRYFTFIDLLTSYPNENVRDEFPNEAAKFLSLYPGFEKTAEIIFWIGEHYRTSNESQKAYITYGKVQTFFPEHSLVPRCLFNQAIIEENDLKQYKKAVENYHRFINKYPDNKLTQKAAFRIPEIYRYNLKDWQNAVNFYNKYAADYKDSEMAILSLQKAAQVLQKEMKQVDSAVEVYELIDQVYPNTDAAREALFTAGELYEKQKYFKSAIEQYTKLFTKYKESEKGRTGMERTALIYLDKLKDNDNALKILNMIIENYPGTPSAKQAEKRLESLTKE